MQRTSGFTLLELIVASAIAMVLLTMVMTIVKTTGNARTQQTSRISTQQALRASVELISQDLRSAIGARVNYTGLTSLALPVSGANTLTVLVPYTGSTFPVTQPASGITISSASLTPVNSMTSQEGVPCSSIFNNPAGSGQTAYGMFMSTTGTNIAVGTSFSPPPDSSQLLQFTASPCNTTYISHSSLAARSWNANTFLVGIQPIVYSISNGNLVRQIYGTDPAPQIVAFGINNMQLTYQAAYSPTITAGCDSANFLAQVSCPPANIMVTLTSGGTNPQTYSQMINLRY